MTRPTLCIVTPALASANNGNWQTARRWAAMLAADYRVRIQLHWDGDPADALIALHARRSAEDVAAWHERLPGHPLVLALTGTDLYRDLAVDATARRSLDLADRLVVLNEQAPLALAPDMRRKCIVCLQSSRARRVVPKPTRHLRALMVGHLREEKRPQTYFAAARRLAGRADIRLDHVGAPLDEALGRQAAGLQRELPSYRWLGALDHATTRRRIQQAHVLVHPSRMEGGAHVVIEAVVSGTPVLASRIAGNLGLLGAGYEGSFDLDDDAALAALIERCRDDPAMLPRLSRQCAARAPLFDPARERATLRRLMSDLMESRR